METIKKLFPFSDLTRFEWGLWILSVGAIALSALCFGGDLLSTAASLIGVTSLIFLAKGYVFGQVLMVIFSLCYGAISLLFRYYGEAITYVGMTMPMALLAVFSWMRHTGTDSRSVIIHRLTRGQWILGWILTAAVTAVFYFILKGLGNASLFFSTLSIATSFIAAYLSYFRSPYSCLGYAANDVVLIVLWLLAAAQDPSCTAMIVCFSVFLLNDLYGFFSWKKREGETFAS
ncbi:MAG: nicotinamide mononucleotide transporter [Oscillospiraceae bacterium]|nr:nicotinamide mononucleotide transporter [Oscillospiraceae bacterium]